MVLLVALADAHEDLDRLLERRLLDHDRLEAPLERSVALDVLAVLVERRRADALELAARQRRLEDVGGVDRALGGPAPTSVCSSSMKRTASLVLRSSSMIFLRRSSNSPRYFVPATERPDVEGQDALVEQRLRRRRDDPVGQSLGDRGLADAGLADQPGCSSAPEDLDDPLDLLLAPDDWSSFPTGRPP